MNDRLRTVGAETQQIYWVRRLLVLGAMMLLAISVVLIIHGTSSGGEVEAHPSSAPTDGTEQLGPVVCATDEPPTQSATDEPPSQMPTPAPSKTKKTPSGSGFPSEEAVPGEASAVTQQPNPVVCQTDEVPQHPTVPPK